MASSESLSPFCLALLLASILGSSEARDFLVGGNDNAWRVPPNTTDSLNQWAENNRFQVGDSLEKQDTDKSPISCTPVWKYEAAKDSVLQVTRDAYLGCNRSSPVAEHKDGATVVRLHRPGAYYFISGAAGACEEGEKLIVVVMSERHSLRGLATAPSPAESEGPAIAPTSAAPRAVVFGSGGTACSLAVLGMLM
ncbi:early nodulin-like protein [Musa troglodytarum]|uniref:Early nodulin-like protein n=1 Tax=Musa troglodytarum TaxID=320322 RepID=A0A9E7FHV8_9LILI|nr:early nodulin-like protein [Musa troglodytarum]